MLYPDFEFLEQVQARGPFGVEACFQCRKCSNGCPVTFAMDLCPDRVIRMVLLGQREKVLRCRTIWVCAACVTCTTRCPNEVKIAELMDCLKEMALQSGLPCPQPHILALHEAFLENIRKRGRLFEGTLLPLFRLRSGGVKKNLREGAWKDEMRLGWNLFKKERLTLFPKRIRGTEEVRAILSGRGQKESTP